MPRLHQAMEADLDRHREVRRRKKERLPGNQNPGQSAATAALQ